MATATVKRSVFVAASRIGDDSLAVIARVASLPPAASSLSSFEMWCVIQLERWYLKALTIKCPFFRRRASDFLDAADMIVRFLVIRHKSLDIMGPPPGWRCAGDTCPKRLGLSTVEVASIIRQDWREDNNKGYYITGRLNTTIYRDDCEFDGPDPDMPVKGLRKYLNAASQLFDQGKSRAKLLSLDVVDGKIIARWEMKGVLRLPWKPVLPTWTGSTVYHRDEDGLIHRHEEEWDMSVFQAFMRTFLPRLARRIWHKKDATIGPDEACDVPAVV